MRDPFAEALSAATSVLLSSPAPPTHERDPNYYPRPRHGWTCFFCGETFGSPASASIHFGAPNAKPGCTLRINRNGEYSLLHALRMAEYQRDELEVRLVCLRLGQADLEAESVERFRAQRGLLAEMAAFHEEEHRAHRSSQARANAT